MRFRIALSLWAAAAAACADAQMIAIKNVRLIDGSGREPVENATVVVEGTRIRSVGAAEAPAGATVIDGTGRTLIPGLINAHGHLGLIEGTQSGGGHFTRENVEKQLSLYASYGVTAVVSLGMNSDLIYSLRGKAPGAQIFSADRGFGVKDGAPPIAVGPDQIYRPESAVEARTLVNQSALRHPDILKVWVDDLGGSAPKMKPEIYTAVISEAHKRKLRVAAHVYNLADAKALVDASIDVLAHSVRDLPVDQELIAAMKKRGVFYVPTLELDEAAFIYADAPPWINDPFFTRALGPGVLEMITSDAYRTKTKSSAGTARSNAAFAMGLRNLKALHDAGVKVAMGTDSGAQPIRVQGFAEHRELQLMVQAGLTPAEALVCATKNGAAMIGAAKLGTIEAGKDASLVLLGGNPLDGIQHTMEIEKVWIAGKETPVR